MSVQFPDVGIKPAHVHQITPDVGVIVYLDMLAHSTLPDKRPSWG
jgi:hypothetical protein